MERDEDHGPILRGYPRNPYNDVICNDTIAASGVFTAKELCKLSKGSYNGIPIPGFPAIKKSKSIIVAVGRPLFNVGKPQ